MGETDPMGVRRIGATLLVLAQVAALTVLGGCATGVRPGPQSGRDILAFLGSVRRVQRLAARAALRPWTQDDLERHVRVAAEIAERQPTELARRSMASELLDSLHRAESLFRVPPGILPRGYVPVLVADGDSDPSARIAAVPLAAFTLPVAP